ATFKDVFPDYEDALLNICREGLALGVTVVATAKQTSGLSYRYMSNFATRLAFCCTEASEYGSIFDRCQIRPKNLQGRGLVSVDKTVYEYQAFLPFDGLPASAAAGANVAAGAVAAGGAEERRSESRRIEQAKAFMARIASAYGGERARPVPSIPPVLTEDWWKREARGFGAYAVPVGLTYSEIEPVTVDLARVGSVGICGREGSGKSGLLRTVLRHLQRHVFDMPCEAHLIDGYDRQLAEFGAFGFVERLTVDAAEFEGVVQRFGDAAKERMGILRDGGSIESEPLLLCVVQNRQVFAAGAVDKAACELFRKLLADARQLKICFIFSDVENSQEYSPPEMLRIARDFGMFFLLDDLANIRLFGTGKFSPGDLKAHKKPIALGDGYVCDARGGLDKVKLVKCDKSDKNDKSDKSEGSA
ncbi:MAG: hypothetical protein LBL83_12110, partial [Clostridiales bacterium]|nr:hypothetical protein [Clostridiales bacterium]